MFRPVEAKWDPPAFERKVLEWWREHHTFKILLPKRGRAALVVHRRADHGEQSDGRASCLGPHL